MKLVCFPDVTNDCNSVSGDLSDSDSDNGQSANEGENENPYPLEGKYVNEEDRERYRLRPADVMRQF